MRCVAEQCQRPTLYCHAVGGPLYSGYTLL